MLKGVIFDLDGTLIRLPVRYDLLRDQLKRLFQSKSDFFQLIPSIVDQAKGDPAMVRRAFELICVEELLGTSKIVIIKGALDLLHQLKSDNKILGLVTLQCRKAARHIINNVEMEGLFSSILTRDESYDRHDQIEKTLKSLGLLPDETIVIGDRLNDIEAAERAGCKSILVGRKPLENENVSVSVERLDLLSDNPTFWQKLQD
ncbi:MAG: HAD hydrolase-like protein [Nitrososphaerales archaeon]